MPSQEEKQEIREQLEVTQAAFHRLVAELDEHAWSSKSGNPDLTVKEVVWHIAWAMSWMAGSVDAVKEGRNFKLPRFAIEPARGLAMRWLARKATPAAALAKYDAGHTALTERLATVSDEEWSRSATRMGEKRTVEWYFRHPPKHFAEHAADVRAASGSRAGA